MLNGEVVLTCNDHYWALNVVIQQIDEILG